METKYNTKKIGEEKWRGPGVVIGRDGKMVVVKHGGLLRNVTKVHITRIQGLLGEEEGEMEEDETVETAVTEGDES